MVSGSDVCEDKLGHAKMYMFYMQSRSHVFSWLTDMHRFIGFPSMYRNSGGFIAVEPAIYGMTDEQTDDRTIPHCIVWDIH